MLFSVRHLFSLGLFHILIYKLKVVGVIYKMRNIFGTDELINDDQVQHSNYLG